MRWMGEPAPEIRSLRLGEMYNLVHLIEDPGTHSLAVVDPAWDVAAILASARDATITDILVTHWHEDHTNGIDDLVDRTGARVHVLAMEAEYWGVTIRPLLLHGDGDHFPLGDLDIEIIHTPGHSPGSACYRVKDALFTGDTLFIYGCGRCDLPGSDPIAMFHSLRDILKRFPPDTRVYPGHDYAAERVSSLERQYRLNPFLHQDTLEAFVAFRAEHNRHRHPPYQPVPRGKPAW